ncbi:MAG: hypothetical protein KC503_32490 [Myxococcales bacterium]|nr:hypothetical protein [Myxococcales bacterium]
MRNAFSYLTLTLAILGLGGATMLGACASSSAPPAKVDGRGTDGGLDGQPDADPCAGKSCDDKLSCTEDTCVAGKCENTLKADACLIDGKCYAKGQGDNATNSCYVCDPSQSSSAWSDDTSLCADDGKSCTDAKCVSGKCEHEVQLGYCLVSGSCYQDGAADPNNECQVCDSGSKSDGFSAKSNGAACAADALSCTDDVCDAGSCTHPVKSGSCLISGACYADGEVNPTSDCQGCDASAEQLAWTTRADGSACADDGLTCTEDKCQSGACSHPLKANTCLITGSCFAANDTNPQAECQLCNPATSTSAWTNKAGGTPCTSDGLACTNDVCGAGVCTHPVAANTCLISGSCYNDGDNHPGVQCRRCIASQSNTQWSVTPDGVACADDSLSCTDDVCGAGICTHPIRSGQCLINNACYAADAQVGASTSCNSCVPSVSQIAATLTDGRSCDDNDSGTGADMCLAGICRGFNGWTWEWSGTDTDTALHDVVRASDGNIWVAGSFVNGFSENRGLMARLSQGTVSNLTLVTAPMRSLHHRVAVGDNGTTRWFNGIAWVNPTIGNFGGANLTGVWGRTFASTSAHYISGDGVLQLCETIDNGANFACGTYSGFGTDNLRRVVGTVMPSGAPDRLWAARGSVAEDIFSAQGGSTVLSKAAPEGCTDSAGSPCGNSPGPLLDLWARDANEVWAVGNAGLVLRYDGAGWTSVQIPTITGPEAPQVNYVFRGVHGDGDLVILVGERTWGGLFYDLIMVVYNRALDRWFDVRAVDFTNITDPRLASWRLNAVGGPLTNLYIVGSKWVIGETQQKALHIARP